LGGIPSRKKKREEIKEPITRNISYPSVTLAIRRREEIRERRLLSEDSGTNKN